MDIQTFLQENDALLHDFETMSRAVGDRADYVQGGGGNTSVKVAGNLMAIKASGFCLSDIRADQAYAVLSYPEIASFYTNNDPDAFADVEAAGAEQAKINLRQIEGLPSLRPSVEAGFHSLLDRFVLHSHSVYANLIACSKEWIDLAEKVFADAAYDVAYVPYTDPGASLSFSVSRALGQNGKRPNVLLMQNHGIIVHHDEMAECLSMHEDANSRVASFFDLRLDAYPRVQIKKMSENLYQSETRFLTQQMREGRFNEDFFLKFPIYPDQLVFLKDTFSFGKDAQEGQCKMDPETGLVTYRMKEKEAKGIEETLTAVVFIAFAIQGAGLTISPMGQNAQDFVSNWESEHYRKSLAGN